VAHDEYLTPTQACIVFQRTTDNVPHTATLVHWVTTGGIA
jgi:hypothetical protein